LVAIFAHFASRRDGPGEERKAKMPTQKKRWVSLPEALETMGVSRSTFDRWRRQGVAPKHYTLPGGTIHFEESELYAWIEQHAQVGV
jgi:predicted DNA-binding transcriptional regulator AlpA